MTKYIRVIEKINGEDKKIVLRFNKCNDCPLMVEGKRDFIVSCRKFNINGNKIINDFVDYDVNNGELQTIPVPNWCGLPNDIYDLNLYKETYMKIGNSLLTSTGNIEKNLPIYDISYMKQILKKQDTDFNNILPITLVDNRITDMVENPFDFEYDRIIYRGNDILNPPKHREVEEEEDDDDREQEYLSTMGTPIRQLPHLREVEEEEDDDDYVSPIRVTTPTILVCSCCGGHDTSVIRDINNGMCETCYNTYKDDIIKLKQSFINNFRLKRGVIFVDRDFKLIEQ